MSWTLQNLKDSENKQEILHYSSIFSAATVPLRRAQACVSVNAVFHMWEVPVWCTLLGPLADMQMLTWAGVARSALRWVG
jgi:hypothetical protein